MRSASQLGPKKTNKEVCRQDFQVQCKLRQLVHDDPAPSEIHPLPRSGAVMLGTRRASVTVAAGIVQKAGLITDKRGQVNLEKRPDLDDPACTSYAHPPHHMTNHHPNPPHPHSPPSPP